MTTTNDRLKAAATGAPAPTTAVTTEAPTSPGALTRYLDKFKPQLALVLPKHLTPDRMCRLMVTQFSKTPRLYQSEPHTVVGSLLTASIMGLEIGVQGQGFLVPYNNRKANNGRGQVECQFIPGWRGLVDLANRSGSCTVFSGAVFKGDFFEYEQGARPDVRHRSGDEDDPAALTHVYAVGWVGSAKWPVVEVWTAAKVRKHRDRFNRQGNDHYSFREWEMYARKVPLLQVLKYMPSSTELRRAMEVADAAEAGNLASIDADMLNVTITPIEDEPEQRPADTAAGASDAVKKPEARGKRQAPAAAAAETKPAGAPAFTYEQLAKAIDTAKTMEDAAQELDLGRTLSVAEFESLQKLYATKWGKS